MEARIFEGAMGHDTFQRLGEVACEVTVAVGGENVGPALFAPLVIERLPRGRQERHPQLSHFGPMEDPAAIAAAIRGALHLG
jgi:hypothetical protein